LTCPHCPYNTKLRQTLQGHVNIAHDQNCLIFACPHDECSFTTKRLSSFRKHHKRHGVQTIKEHSAKAGEPKDQGNTSSYHSDKDKEPESTASFLCPDAENFLCKGTFPHPDLARAHSKERHSYDRVCTVHDCRYAVSKHRLSRGAMHLHMKRHKQSGHLKAFQTPPQPKKVPALRSLEEVVDKFWLSRLSAMREDVENSKYPSTCSIRAANVEILSKFKLTILLFLRC
jgi:hypothetical protein